MEKIKVPILSEYKDLFDETYRYLVYHGGRYSGKSHSVAIALLLRGRMKPLRILCTREIQNTIKDSVHKLLSDMIYKYEFHDYKVQKDSIVNKVTGTEFIFRGLKNNINELKSTEGVDIAWVEEAQSITDHSLDVLTPTIRKEGSQIIFTFNRFTELDPVYVRFVMQKPPKTLVRQVNYDALERNGLLTDAIKVELEKDKENKELFAHKWLGEPISQDEFSIIPRNKAMEAMSRTIEPEGSIEVGVDVARMGDDRIVFWMVHGIKTIKKATYQKKETPQTCDLLEKFVGDKSILLKIDDTGVGGGVTDEMKRRGYNVSPINFGAKARDKDKYPNLISEAWFYLESIMNDVDLPEDRDLLMELTTRQWKQDVKGRRVVESKQDYKKRGYRSPDLADACIIAYYRAKPKAKAYTTKPVGL